MRGDLLTPPVPRKIGRLLTGVRTPGSVLPMTTTTRPVLDSRYYAAKYLDAWQDAQGFDLAYPCGHIRNTLVIRSTQLRRALHKEGLPVSRSFRELAEMATEALR